MKEEERKRNERVSLRGGRKKQLQKGNTVYTVPGESASFRKTGLEPGEEKSSRAVRTEMVKKRSER
jgi:hypothetical protein